MKTRNFGFLLLTLFLALASACGGNGENSNNGAYYDENYGSENATSEEYCCMCLGTGTVRINSYPYSFKCSACGGKGVSDDSRYNTTKPLYRCEYCNGSGKNEFNGEPCSVCHGYGVTMFSPQEQDRSMQHNQDRGSLCSACGGSGKCPVCHGSDGNNKYGNNFCRTCGNTGDCPWCYGTGQAKK